jgi:hypothetical protein
MFRHACRLGLEGIGRSASGRRPPLSVIAANNVLDSILKRSKVGKARCLSHLPCQGKDSFSSEAACPDALLSVGLAALRNGLSDRDTAHEQTPKQGRQHHRRGDRLIVGKLDQLALAMGSTAPPSGARATARPPPAGSAAVRTPITWIRCIDMRSDTGVELVHQPSDRTARWPLAVRPAMAGRRRP